MWKYIEELKNQVRNWSEEQRSEAKEKLKEEKEECQFVIDQCNERLTTVMRGEKEYWRNLKIIEEESKEILEIEKVLEEKVITSTNDLIMSWYNEILDILNRKGNR